MVKLKKNILLSVVNDDTLEGDETISLYIEKEVTDKTVSIKNTGVLEIHLIDDDGISAPNISADIVDGLGEVTVSGMVNGSKLTLYNSLGGVSDYIYNVTSDAAIFVRVPEGTGYYVTQSIGDSESETSNLVDIIIPKITSLIDATIALVKGSNHGTTKVVITNRGDYTYHANGYNYNEDTYPSVGKKMVNLGIMSQENTNDVIANVDTFTDQYVYVYQVDKTGVVIGFDSVKVREEDVKPHP